ncbi:class I SAM-dependent methyltransferase [Streptomyces iconiensis]|uniref:Class I SAM-dependent methyltransferase n=1 Tax=Streptomyces iconiensis TaxID=1384038 RepID=A0ABT7A4D8_9ACTN|nr:class I SAM-dependent methyltransferase [Streptomyces iconiensis]MDJ1136203.1 class I SAM-dependent methyltransferase [Streptomyces iconiensis]
MTGSAWDTYARSKRPRPEVNSCGERTWFNWTQFPDHGPGAEVLGVGPGATALELGCGKGGNAAHVARLGVRCIAVDLSGVQVQAARKRWADVDDLEFHQREAVDYLGACDYRFDAVFSVFGALWFTDPAVLLPAIRGRMAPGGVLAFSHRPAFAGCYGCQAAFISSPDAAEPLVVQRWDYEPKVWADMLTETGYVNVQAGVIEAPHGGVGTLLVHGQNPGV